jgi:hypothetical protein
LNAGQVGHLERCRDNYWGNQTTRPTLGCSTMSGHHSGIGFIQFG